MSTQPKLASQQHGAYKTHYGLYVFLTAMAVAALFSARHMAAVDTVVLTSPAMVRAGSTVDLPLTLKTSSNDLSALEWQIDLPPAIQFEATSSVDGKVAQCYKQHCMLYGGLGPIPPGVIAILSVHLPDAAAADISVGLHDVLGATSAAASRRIVGTRLSLKLQR